MHRLLPDSMVDLSIRHSERLRFYTVAMVATTALVVLAYPVLMEHQPLLSKHVPIVIFTFLVILTPPMLAEYLAVWSRKLESIHVYRCALCFAAVALALLEILALLWAGSPANAAAAPFSVSAVLGKLL